MQLQAYLKSLLLLGTVPPDTVSVIIPSTEGYESLIDKLPDLAWITEDSLGGFDLALREYTEHLNNDDIVLFGCDDVVFIRPFALLPAEQLLRAQERLIGFSLRLGLNIYPRPLQDGYSQIFHFWEWQGMPSHWGYPFELMASCYRASLVKEIVQSSKNPIHTPNFLESYGVNYCINNKYIETPTMACYRSDNYAVAQDVNRVQHDFQNKVSGDSTQDAEALKELFKQGKRLDWTNLFNFPFNDVFVGNTRWKII